jgi:inner membrane protein
METTSSPSPIPSLLERFNTWLQESVMIKLFSIGFLILILLIPSAWINDLIYERQSRAAGVMQEVSDKWSGQQTISGPVLVIPFRKKDIIDKGKDGIETREHIENAFFLPEQLTIKGEVAPETLHRGIFDAVVYQSKIQITSAFSKPNFEKLNIPADMIQWKDSYMIFGITDLRGISDSLVFSVGDQNLISEPSNNIGVSVTTRNTSPFNEERYLDESHEGGVSKKGITAKLNWKSAEDFTGAVQMKLNLKGSKTLDFVPTGKTTDVQLSGSWKDPSFDGVFIPITRQIDENRFAATWKILHFNRPFSQEWTNENQTLSEANFGVKLLVPVDQYQKSTRTAKYGILIILLTFIALFLVEITQKIRIHPFQYILIGAALTIYYTLLLSLSEHMGYNLAYLVSSIATVVLVSSYSKSFLKELRLTVLFTLLLIVSYTFIFVIILQQDFALLIGSIGLFVIIGMLMYFSRKIKWYTK